MTDIVTNFWSMGLQPGAGQAPARHHATASEAADGWFIMQVGREHQFARLAELVGHPEWVDDPRFATRQGWADHLDDVHPPGGRGLGVGDTSKLEACHELGRGRHRRGPVQHAPRTCIADPHVAARHMLVEMPRTDGVEQPVLVPGNPVKLSKMAEGPETRVPGSASTPTTVLGDELGLSADQLAELRAAGVIS